MKFKKTLAAILVLLMFLQLLPLELNISGSDSTKVNVFAAPSSPVNSAIKVSNTSAVSTPTKIITSMSSSSTPSTKLKSTPMNSPVSSSNVSLNLDKTIAEVGDIITANVSINNILNFAGINVSLKYDPNTLQPIEPSTKAYTDSTVPGIGNILNNTSYTPFSAAANKISEGILNFNRLYYNLSTYKMSGKSENSGIVAVVLFKVLKPNVTQISLEEPNSVSGNISGTYAYNWDGKLINSGFSIIQPKTINPTGPTCIPTQTPVPTPTLFTQLSSTEQAKSSLSLQNMAISLASVTNGKISGYIRPDFDYNTADSSKIFANLKVRITSVGNQTDVKYSTGVGSNGYFEINNINVSNNVDIIISKYDAAGNEISGYLRRCISNFNIDSTNISFGTQNDPMDIWAGDLNKDGVINTVDQIALAQAFNSFEGDTKYNANADFNKDGVINTADLIILAKHYTATTISYPSLPNIMIKSGVTYINNSYTLSGDKSFGESVVNSNAVLNLSSNVVLTFAGNLTVNGSINVNKGTINVNGNLIHDSVGTIDVNAGNINITGNLNQNTGTIDINRGTVRVQKNAGISDTGNFVQNGSSIPGKSSTIRINSGKLLVDGNYTIPDTNNNYSRLIMRNAADYVLVGGSFLNYSHVDSSINNNNTPDGDRLKCFTDGVLEVKGDFIQGGNARSFVSSDNHKVILSGTGLQNVNFNSYQNGESCFNLLEITNTGETNGVVFAGNPVTITSLEKCTKIFSNFKLRKLLKPLKTDIVVNGDFIIDNPESGTNIDIGNKNGTKIDLNSHSVTVNGSIIQKGGLLDINHGNLNVNYDLILDTSKSRIS
ncbi:MAG TPA: dockerin type I domain-containing protein [Pseudobacteroides sp.]|uniref:dockerin type I domain-containing protein n=1 Tax=Pseudobacteroides sp. TaxID=1968840 RepID=UPI002F940AD5